jgi:hypothetical protein
MERAAALPDDGMGTEARGAIPDHSSALIGDADGGIRRLAWRWLAPFQRRRCDCQISPHRARPNRVGGNTA